MWALLFFYYVDPYPGIKVPSCMMACAFKAGMISEPNKKLLLRLARWPNGLRALAVLPETIIQFLAHIWQFTTVCNPAPSELTASHRQTYMQTKHTEQKQINIIKMKNKKIKIKK